MCLMKFEPATLQIHVSNVIFTENPFMLLGVCMVWVFLLEVILSAPSGVAYASQCFAAISFERQLSINWLRVRAYVFDKN